MATPQRDPDDMTGVLTAPPVPEAPSARRPTLAPPSAPAKPRRMTWRVFVFLFAVLAVLGMAVWAVAWYARGAYYVGIDQEQVAIFRGRPGGLLWFDPTLVERKQQPTGAELLPAQRVELDAGHEVPSKAAADRYVNNLRQEVEARRAPPTTVASSTTSTSTSSSTSTTRP